MAKNRVVNVGLALCLTVVMLVGVLVVAPVKTEADVVDGLIQSVTIYTPSAISIFSGNTYIDPYVDYSGGGECSRNHFFGFR